MRYFEVTAADTSVMSQIRDHGEKFVQPCSPFATSLYRPCTVVSRWVAWASNCHAHYIQFKQSRYTDTHTHTLDLNRENHGKENI